MPLRQVHFRATEKEHRFLRSQAQASEESVAVVLRRLIRRAMRAVDEENKTEPVPRPLRPDSSLD